MKYAYFILVCCLSCAGCSEYSVGWGAHPQEASVQEENAVYYPASTDKKMQEGKASGVTTNTAGDLIWIWQKDFWTK